MQILRSILVAIGLGGIAGFLLAQWSFRLHVWLSVSPWVIPLLLGGFLVAAAIIQPIFLASQNRLKLFRWWHPLLLPIPWLMEIFAFLLLTFPLFGPIGGFNFMYYYTILALALCIPLNLFLYSYLLRRFNRPINDESS